MSTHEQPGEQPKDHEPSSVAIPDGANGGTAKVWIFAIIAAIAAGIGSWAIVEGVLSAYSKSFEPTTRPYPTAEDTIRITRARIVSGTMTFGATGGLLGLALGLAAGASRKSIKAAVSAGLAGLLLGGLAEAAVAFGALSFIYKNIDLNDNENLLQTLLSHEALWAVVGLAAGLAFGLGLDRPGVWWKTAIGGLIGAMLATIVYEFLGALVFPNDGTHLPYSDTAATRIMAQVLITFGSAIGAVVASGGRKKKPAAS